MSVYSIPALKRSLRGCYHRIWSEAYNPDSGLHASDSFHNVFAKNADFFV